MAWGGNRDLEREASVTAGSGATQVLTTSSMTGSGLAASSCSFTFSSTRGRKDNTGLRDCHSRDQSHASRSSTAPGPHPLSHSSGRGFFPRLKADPGPRKGQQRPPSSEWEAPVYMASVALSLRISSGSPGQSLGGLASRPSHLRLKTDRHLLPPPSQ